LSAGGQLGGVGTARRSDASAGRDVVMARWGPQRSFWSAHWRHAGPKAQPGVSALVAVLPRGPVAVRYRPVTAARHELPVLPSTVIGHDVILLDTQTGETWILGTVEQSSQTASRVSLKSGFLSRKVNCRLYNGKTSRHPNGSVFISCNGRSETPAGLGLRSIADIPSPLAPPKAVEPLSPR
jgi:hypothetical protein